MKIIVRLLEAILIFFNLKIKEAAKKEKQKQEEKKEQLNNLKKENHNAVHTGDVDKINKLINSCIVIALLFICGCVSTEIIYVTSDRQVKKLTYENVEGYFVPNAVMAELLDYKTEAIYYKDQYELLKREESK